MEPIYKYTIYSLSDRDVVLQTDIYLPYDGKQVKVKTEKGQILNTEQGREKINDIPDTAQNVKQAILAMWGDKTIDIPHQSPDQFTPNN